MRSPEHLRAVAGKFRALAHAARTPFSREQMARTAATYDWLAQREEARRQRTRLFNAHLEGCLPGFHETD